MNHFYRLFLVGFMSLGLSATPLLTHATTPTIFVSEVAWAGSSLSASDEFIELFNTTNNPISLANWSLHGSATGGEALSLPQDAVIQPHSTYLIANYDVDNENSALEVIPDFATSSLSLGNTKLSVALVDDTGAVLDQVGDGVGSPPAGSVGVSMTRIDSSLNGSVPEAWASTESSRNFKTGLSDLGTPGFHEPPSPPAPESQEEEVTTPAPLIEPEPQVEAPPIQVLPNNQNVITVIYQGYVFALNLPDQHLATSVSAMPEVVSSPPATSMIEVAVSPAPVPSAPNVTPTVVEPEATPEPVVTAMSLQTLRFSEIYPNTTGNDEEEEYIEIENFGNAPIDLNGWSVSDATEKTWTADGSLVLQAQGVVALARPLTKITLNNSNETLKLMHPNRQVVDLIAYGASTKGLTYTRNGDTWSWQNPTPNEIVASPVSNVTEEETSNALVVPNIVMSSSAQTTSSVVTSSTSEEPETVVLSVTEATTSTTKQSASSTKTSTSSTSLNVRAMTVREARQAVLGSSVRVEGTVIATPGTFTTQSFYLEDDAGIQVYLHSADFPVLSLGDRVRVSGVTSQNRGEARIKLASASAIEVLSSGNTSPQEAQIDTINESTEAELVTVEGLVESARSDEMTLVKDAVSLRVSARERTGISFAAIGSGSTVRITGIVSETNGAYSLLPRSQSDIQILDVGTPEASMVPGLVSPQKPPTGLYGTLLLLASVSLLGFWFLKSRNHSDLTLTNV